jgi:hypothetical protein
VKHQKTAWPLQPLLIPEWKLENIVMDFVLSLPRGKNGSNAIWVIVDIVMKSALFLPMKMIDSANKLAKMNVNQMLSD